METPVDSEHENFTSVLNIATFEAKIALYTEAEVNKKSKSSLSWITNSHVMGYDWTRLLMLKDMALYVWLE